MKFSLLRLSAVALGCGLTTLWAFPAKSQEMYSDAALQARMHPPLSSDAPDTTPRPYNFVEPAPLNLPSSENLETTTVKDRTFNIVRVPATTNYPSAPGAREKLAIEGQRFFEADDEPLFFRGTGGGGRRSKERLIVENCTFIIDFQQGNFNFWEPRRCAIYVNGYREVLIRKCVFISKARKGDPDRKVNASISAEDCLKVQIEDCYFEGLTNWMRGHITVFSCGPTTIRRVEIAGQKQGNNLMCGGGIWVANGIGEGKLGAPPHAAQPDLMIYPSGPLLVEDCYVHDQKGELNTDAIYVQSIHPFVIRNCRVENWQEDGLIDVGFRDSARGVYKGKPLVNHGAVGIIENCQFAKGHLKDSVGAGGGIVFRNNLVKEAWIFPYIFDGGSWYVVNNQFTDLRGPIVSGLAEQTGGWVPVEGMLIGGSKMYFYNNEFQTRQGDTLPALWISSPVAVAPLKGNIVSNGNLYLVEDAPLMWADDRATKTQYATFADWQKATGNDSDSIVATRLEHRQSNPKQVPVTLPGKVPANTSKTVGLTGPVGPDAGLMARAAETSLKVAAEMTASAPPPPDGLPPVNEGTLEIEDLLVKANTGKELIYHNAKTSAGKYRLWEANGAGDSIAFALTPLKAGHFSLKGYFFNQNDPGLLQLQLDGKAVGAPVAIAQGMEFKGLTLDDTAEHVLTFQLVGPAGIGHTIIRFDRLDLVP